MSENGHGGWFVDCRPAQGVQGNDSTDGYLTKWVPATAAALREALPKRLAVWRQHPELYGFTGKGTHVPPILTPRQAAAINYLLNRIEDPAERYAAEDAVVSLLADK